MAQASDDRGRIISGINVTPLVDITLVLLIIFIVTARILVTPAVPMDLPKATHGRDIQVVFATVLTADGATLVNGTAIADDRALVEQARAALAQNPDGELRAVIQADGAVPHRRVMAVLDSLKQAGIEHIAFAVESAGKAKHEP